MKRLEWQVDTRRWRWWMLTSLGCAPLACGGRTIEPVGGSGSPPAGGGRPPVTTPTTTSEPRTSEPRGPGSSAGGPTPVSFTPARSACENPTSDGGGWETCANGLRRRVEIRGECSSPLPRSQLIPNAELLAGVVLTDAGLPTSESLPPYVSCIQDNDCTEQPHGHCELAELVLQESALTTYCVYGCLSDRDCGVDQACLCGDPVGTCVPAACKQDGDCPAGLSCAVYHQQPYCGGPALACQSPADECAVDADCPGGSPCTIAEGARQRTCSNSICTIGRPFLVDGQERLALAATRADWLLLDRLGADRQVGPLSPALRESLARAWTEQALMEHASIAAFARFTLQLMSLGAPADLVLRASRAMADETRHAQQCFSLARRYSGRDVGPGPLALDGALQGADPISIVLTTIQEGCIGETVAAIEGAEALAHCQDPVTRGVLEQIAKDESEHAALAWRFVKWAVERWPEVAAAVRAEFAACADEGAPASAVALSEADQVGLEHGVMSHELRVALRRRVLREVVRPSADALFLTAEVGRAPKPQKRTAPNVA